MQPRDTTNNYVQYCIQTLQVQHTRSNFCMYPIRNAIKMINIIKRQINDK